MKKITLIKTGRPEGIDSSDDRSCGQFIQKTFGKWTSAGGSGFSLDLETAEALVNLMKRMNLKKVSGSYMTYKLENGLDVSVLDLKLPKYTAVVFKEVYQDLEDSD